MCLLSPLESDIFLCNLSLYRWWMKVDVMLSCFMLTSSPVLCWGWVAFYISKIAVLWLPICTSFDFLFLSLHSCFELLWCAIICNLPPAHVFIFRVLRSRPWRQRLFFFIEQLEELATWHVGTLPHTVVTLSCVNGSVCVSVYWRLTSGFNKGPPTTKSILDECIWRVLAL